MKSLLMPVLALVCGLVSLHVDPKDRRKRWLLVGGLLATTAVTIWLNIDEGRAKALELSKSEQREQATSRILETLAVQTRPIPDLVVMLRDFGFTAERAQGATVQSVSTSLAADRAYRELVASRRNTPRPAVRVEYFPKDVDGARVIKALEDAGLEVVRKSSSRPEPSNAIWAGDQVPIDDVKVVALALMRAGVDVVSIRRFREGSGPKAQLIQIGVDAALAGRPTLTPQSVMNVTALTRAGV